MQLDREGGAVPRNLMERAEAAEITTRLRETLASNYLDAELLRADVRKYVASMRHGGASLGSTIEGLTRIAELSTIAPMSKRQAAVRQLIYWCVEAYYWRLDVGLDAPTTAV
jgi:hypothetical protein